MSSWSLTTVRTSAGTTAAIRRDDGSYVVPDALGGYAGLREVLSDWAVLRDRLRLVDPESLTPVEATELLSIQHPNKVLCVGANYRDHLAEMGVTEIPEGVKPFFFSVPPSTALVGDGAEIVVSEEVAAGVDWEAELAIVIGIGGLDIPPATALDHVAGYACFNDVTARTLLRRATAIAVPFTWDWLSAKGMDTFSPLGAVTPAWQIDDPGNLTVRCLVNGEVKQQGTTRNLIVGLADLVAAASRTWTLEPGDVIATGTPAGVGHARGEHLHPDDEVVVEIEGLPSLHNTVVLRRTTQDALGSLAVG